MVPRLCREDTHHRRPACRRAETRRSVPFESLRQFDDPAAFSVREGSRVREPADVRARRELVSGLQPVQARLGRTDASSRSEPRRSLYLAHVREREDEIDVGVFQRASVGHDAFACGPWFVVPLLRRLCAGDDRGHAANGRGARRTVPLADLRQIARPTSLAVPTEASVRSDADGGHGRAMVPGLQETEVRADSRPTGSCSSGPAPPSRAQRRHRFGAAPIVPRRQVHGVFEPECSAQPVDEGGAQPLTGTRHDGHSTHCPSAA